MDILARQVSNYLKDKLDLNFGYDEDAHTFQLSVDVEHVRIDVRIICEEDERWVLLLANAPVNIPEHKYVPIFYLINEINMDSLNPVCLFVNEETHKLMAQSVLTIGADYRVDEEVFLSTLFPLLHAIDDHFIEVMRILSTDTGEQNERSSSSEEDMAALMYCSEQGDADARRLLATCYYNGDGVEQDFERAMELWEQLVASGDKQVGKALKECLSDLQEKVEKASDSQDFEMASKYQRLISQCERLLKAASME